MSTQATWTPPDPDAIFDTLEATWPPASRQTVQGWTIRKGLGGGSRVSAATGSGDIAAAQTAMISLGQTPLFMIRPGHDDLDAALDQKGYEAFDAVTAYATSIKSLTSTQIPELAAIPSAAPLAVQKEIWAQGGIGPARLDVMARASAPKTYLMVRHSGRPAGTGFVAIHGGIAMIHALEILPEFRKQGAGRGATCGAAAWAERQGAMTLALVTTNDNKAANTLYQRLGMQPITGYHYRRLPLE